MANDLHTLNELLKPYVPAAEMDGMLYRVLEWHEIEVEDAYERGYDAGYNDNDSEAAAYNEGYEAGFEDGKSSAVEAEGERKDG